MMKLRNKKTGEIIDFEELNGYCLYDCGDKIILGKNSEEPVYGYTTLKEFNEDWEDYKPTEPLIKDEKNRKVVRAWLEANDLDGATFHTSSHFFHYWNLRGFNDNGQGVDIDFFLTGEGIPNLIDGKYYTKFELCGEEEE